jgi:hypothetical protein
MGEEESASGQIGQKASEMATQIELTARDLARVGQEATALASSLAHKVASLARSLPDDPHGPEISQQVHDLAGTIQKTTSDAVRIGEKAVAMASKIAQVPSGAGGAPHGEEPQK